MKTRFVVLKNIFLRIISIPKCTCLNIFFKDYQSSKWESLKYILSIINSSALKPWNLTHFFRGRNFDFFNIFQPSNYQLFPDYPLLNDRFLKIFFRVVDFFFNNFRGLLKPKVWFSKAFFKDYQHSKICLFKLIFFFSRTNPKYFSRTIKVINVDFFQSQNL